jgi:hypothetical protein
LLAGIVLQDSIYGAHQGPACQECNDPGPRQDFILEEGSPLMSFVLVSNLPSAIFFNGLAATG